MELRNYTNWTLLLCAIVLFLGSCTQDDGVRKGSGVRITISQEEFGSLTRSGAPVIVYQDTIELGDDKFIFVSVQEDGISDVANAKTRADEKGIPLTDGSYTVLGYYSNGNLAGYNTGKIVGGEFTFDEDDTFKHHEGTFDFVCVSNVELNETKTIATVTRGQAGSSKGVAKISDPTPGTISGGDIELNFTMRHKESGIRFKLFSPGAFSGVEATLTASTAKPATHEWKLSSLANGYTVAASSSIDPIVIVAPDGASEVVTDYQYFLPGTIAADFTITFMAGTVWGKSLVGKDIELRQFESSLQANKRYTATLNFVDTSIPAFDGIIALGSDDKLTLEGGSDPRARMVYFKGGSVVALSSKATTEVVFNPTSPTTSFSDFASIPAISGDKPDVATSHNVHNGIGDPCRLVGLSLIEINEGKIDNNTWIMPTGYSSATIGDWVPSTAIPTYTGNGATPYPGRLVKIGTAEVFHPAVGDRSSSGVLGNVLSAGFFWTSSNTGGNNLQRLSFESDNSKTKTDGYNPANAAYPVRCVPKPPAPGTGDEGKVPALDYIIAIGSDGKLTLTAETDGDTNARTVYFKYGSLIAQSTSSTSWDDSQVAYTPPGIDNSTWDKIPYVSANTNIDDTYHTWVNVQAGRGDPCRIVGILPEELSDKNFDNGKWRLPTKDERDGAKMITANGSWETLPGGLACNHGKIVKLADIECLMPAAGFRVIDGSVQALNEGGNFWTSQFYNTNSSSSLTFSLGSGSLNALGSGSFTSQDYGLAVRCIPIP